MSAADSIKRQELLGYGLAALTFLKGLSNYLRNGFVSPLASGSLVAGLLAYGSSLTSKDEKNCHILFWTSALLAVYFINAAYTNILSSSGLVFIVACASAIKYGRRIFS